MSKTKWEFCRLDELTELIVRGITPKYAEDGDFIVLNQRCVRDGRINFALARRHDSNQRKVKVEKHLQVGDIVVNSTGVGTLGRTAPVRSLNGLTTADSHLTILRPMSIVEPSWLRYAVSNAEQEIEAMAEGSTGQTELSRHRLAELVLLVPPIAEQRKIARVLGAFDDKIESNQRQIKTLHDLAIAKFTNLEFEGCRQLNEVAQITMGASPKGSTLNEERKGEVFYQGTRDFGFRYPKRRIWTTEPKRMADVGDTLVAVRAPVGTLNRAPERLCVGRGLAAVNSELQSLVFYALLDAKNEFEPYNSEGTVFGAINKKAMNEIQVRWPKDPELVDQEFQVLDEAIWCYTRQNELLRSIRDPLLPKLLSGRITPEQLWRLVYER